ncbi:MAG: riboflavin kinase [Streptococcus sp.]
MVVISPVLDQREKISSTRIRQAVLAGRLPKKQLIYLAHPLSSRGIVVHGDARGRTIGYPTANLAPIDRTYLHQMGFM